MLAALKQCAYDFLAPAPEGDVPQRFTPCRHQKTESGAQTFGRHVVHFMKSGT